MKIPLIKLYHALSDRVGDEKAEEIIIAYIGLTFSEQTENTSRDLATAAEINRLVTERNSDLHTKISELEIQIIKGSTRIFRMIMAFIMFISILITSVLYMIGSQLLNK